nr:methyltransferase [Tessaracoccus coleopterorum]
MRTPIGSALDLGTGCGVQSLHLSHHVDRVVGTDVNGRALELAALTAALNRADIDLRAGSLYEPVAGERFDLIVSNPPFVMSPPTSEAATLTYRESNLEGDRLVETLVRGAADHLLPGGSLQLLTNWAILDEPWEERLRGWVPEGCDAWFIERERLDVFAYIEMWLADAGLAGTERWRPAYDEWLAYFDRLGIRAVGMGWVLITRAGRDVPQVRFESWPHQVAQPVGDVFARNRAAVDASLLPLPSCLPPAPHSSPSSRRPSAVRARRTPSTSCSVSGWGCSGPSGPTRRSPRSSAPSTAT